MKEIIRLINNLHIPRILNLLCADQISNVSFLINLYSFLYVREIRHFIYTSRCFENSCLSISVLLFPAVRYKHFSDEEKTTIRTSPLFLLFDVKLQNQVSHPISYAKRVYNRIKRGAHVTFDVNLCAILSMVELYFWSNHHC